MKNMTFLFVFYLSATLHCEAQFKTKNPALFQQQLDEFYQTEETSPIKQTDIRERIEGLNYFPINKKYVVEGTFHRTEDGEVKTYLVSAGKPRKLKQYGYIEFEWKKKTFHLNVLEELTIYNPEYADFVEIPFFDATNNKTTYGGGRYMWFWKNELVDGQAVTMDFNLTFNPYCAYTKGYACIIPPEENRLPFKVKAGVKNELRLKKK